MAAAEGSEHVVYVWDATSGEVAEELVSRDVFVDGVSFATDGSVHATGIDGTLLKWDLGGDRRFVSSSPPRPELDRAQVPVLLGDRHVAYVTGLLGTAEPDRSLQLRDFNRDRLESAIDPRHEGGVTGAAWRPDGRRVATSGGTDSSESGMGHPATSSTRARWPRASSLRSTTRGAASA